MDFYNANPELKEVLDQIRSGAFLPRSPGPLPPLVDHLASPRHLSAPRGLRLHIACQEQVGHAFPIRGNGPEMSILRRRPQRSFLFRPDDPGILSGHLEGFVRSHFCRAGRDSRLKPGFAGIVPNPSWELTTFLSATHPILSRAWNAAENSILVPGSHRGTDRRDPVPRIRTGRERW